MTEKKLFRRLCTLSILLLMSKTIFANIVWNGGSHDDNVVDMDLDISGTNYLTSPISIINTTISAMFVNITADAVVSSSQELYFFTDNVITVRVAHDFTLSGTNGSNFLITFSGAGRLEFIIDGGTTLSFTEATSASGGAIFLNDLTGNNNPSVIFSNSLINPDDNSTIVVGKRSAISFLGDASGQTGSINFNAPADPSHAGRLILKIDDGGSVINQSAHLTNLPVSLENIQFNQGSSFGSPSLNMDGLLIINSNTTWQGLESNPFCELAPTSTSVARTGFILGAGSVTTVPAGSYIDYVVTVTNITVYAAMPDNVLNRPCQRFLTRVVKDRNPAALIIDGNPDHSNPAVINMSGNSAIYFRSAVDCLGNSQLNTFTINPAANLKNGGTILLDVEGPLIVNGDSDADFTLGTALQILSWQVAPTGGSVLINQADTSFPLRTFAKDEQGRYLQYGSGCFFINNKLQLNNMHLQHTDEIHVVYENNIAGQSSPTYVGGDRLSICCVNNLECPCYAARVTPAIQFYNSYFDLHTDAAVVGLSLQIANDEPYNAVTNNSQFIYFGNGRCIDNGTGRSLILGSEVGSEASDFKTIVDRNAQLDVMQTSSELNPDISLTFTIAYNNTKITPGITEDISGQLGVNTIFLAHASNISVGSQDAMFAGTSLPTITIGAEFFSFMSQGGNLHSPETSSSSGQGGMFIDKNGIVTNESLYRANFGMMVTKSLNGVINLPPNQIFFDPRVGIAQWQLNLNDPSQLLIVGPHEAYSDYTIDWKNLMKDYCSTFGAALFVPYEPTTAPFIPASLYPVTSANLTGLPIIKGEVEQLQIKNSRLGIKPICS